MKLKLLLSLLGAAAITLTGCSDDPDEILPPDPDSLEIVLTEAKVTSTSFTLSVDVNDPDQPYLCLAIARETSDQLRQDKQLIDLIMSDLRKQAEAEGVSFDEFLASETVTGNQPELTIDGLLPGTPYTAVAFAVQGANQTGSKAERLDFTTLSEGKIVCTFDVTPTVEHNNATYEIKPSDKNTQWYFATMPKAQFDQITSEMGMTTEQVLIEYFKFQVQQLADAGMSQEEVLRELVHQGDQTLQAHGLDAGTEYIWLACALKQEGDQLLIISDIATGTYTSGDVEITGDTFEITVDNLRKTAVHVKIVPSDLEARFCWFCMPFTEENKDFTAEEVMDMLLEQNGSWMNMMAVSGIQDYPDYGVVAGQKYYIIAFGYNGGVNTLPVMKTFDVAPGGDPADVKIEPVAKSINPYDVSVEFTPDDETVYYGFNLIPDSEFDEARIIEEVESAIQEMFEMQHQFNPGSTMLDVVTNYFHGVQTYRFTDLKPGVSYTCFVVPLTFEGKVAKCEARKGFLTTPQLSDASLTAKVMGVFDGNEEAGNIFGQPDLTKDKAIVVIKATPSAGATKLFGNMQQLDENGDMLDPQKMPDDMIYSQLFYYWSELNMKAPYMFTVIPWDADQLFFGYALDDKGIMGSLLRHRVPAAKQGETDPIDKLVELVELADVETDTSAVRTAGNTVTPEVPAVSCAVPTKGSSLLPTAEVRKPMQRTDSRKTLRTDLRKFHPSRIHLAR